MMEINLCVRSYSCFPLYLINALHAMLPGKKINTIRWAKYDLISIYVMAYCYISFFGRIKTVLLFVIEITLQLTQFACCLLVGYCYDDLQDIKYKS